MSSGKVKRVSHLEMRESETGKSEEIPESQLPEMPTHPSSPELWLFYEYFPLASLSTQQSLSPHLSST